MILLPALALVSWWLSEPWRLRRRRARIVRTPFPPAWRAILRRRVPVYRRLPVVLQRRLRERVQLFLADKAFIGCDGQAVDDEQRVTIAAQACLLRLGQADGGRFPGLHQVLVYPGPFVVDRVAHGVGGVQQDQRRVLLGESWSQGQVILSWPDARDGAALPDDGHNVVLHEFAHQLDQENGAANGAPPLGSRQRHARWAGVMQAAYAALQARLAAGQPGVIDAYGATDPAEFFAVVTEAFFERPAALADEQPALYAVLSGYHGLDPRAW
ncbi:hypothetical protein ISF6_3634 [Piscinibacter sakaiensis]|uniref:Inner membrane protein n=1 Tax=Piscinibacter sakaiensis TaxID=1547922 RepID=A0A0K8P5B0_PISS1|nr:hypothetical protein ISF6_3634 [Piscinibacter sakaiensis]